MDDQNTHSLSTEGVKKKRRKRKTSGESSHRKTSLKKNLQTPKKTQFNKLIIGMIFAGIVSSGVGYYLFTENKMNSNHNSSHVIAESEKSESGNSASIQFDNLNPEQKEEIIAKKLNTNPLLQGWKPSEFDGLKNYIAKYAIDEKFVQKAKLKNSGIFSLMNSKDMYSDALTEREILNEKTGYPYINTTGVFLNEQGFVKEVLLDSPAYVSGIRKNWQLFNIDNYNKPFFSNDYKINDSLLSKSNSVWRNPANQYYNFTPIQTYPALGAIATGIVQNHILNIQIKEMTIATPGRLYSIIKDNLHKEKINGILIDLRSGSDTINGVQEAAWILNGGLEEVIAIAKNNNNQIFNITSKKPPFEVDQNIINFIKKTKKIVVINQQTKGINEALAYSLQKSGASLAGTSSFGKNTIETTFITGNKGVKISTYTFSLPDNTKLPLIPSLKIDLNILNQLYTVNQY